MYKPFSKILIDEQFNEQFKSRQLYSPRMLWFPRTSNFRRNCLDSIFEPGLKNGLAIVKRCVRNSLRIRKHNILEQAGRLVYIGSVFW